MQWRVVVFGVIFGFCVLLPTFGAANFDRLLNAATARWGASVVPKFNAWMNLIQRSAASPEVDRIRKVNSFFNQVIKFGEDSDVWGQEDYWATPMESLGRGAGDCEDYAIAKYFTLIEAGVSSDKLRLIYVKAKLDVRDYVPAVPHMVLAYYAQIDADPLIMDNLISEVQPASKRSDLTPVFSFNSKGVFSGITGTSKAISGGTGRLSRWENLLNRARTEGFE